MKSTQPLTITYPTIAAEWHPSKNGDKQPDDYTHGSKFKAWWICPDCGAAYDAIIQNRIRSGRPLMNNCPFCCGQRTNDINSLAALRPELAAMWHPTKNNEKTPKDFTCGSHFIAWWACPDCKSEYDLSIKARTKINCGCPFCDGARVNNTNSLAALRQDLANEWHANKNGNKTARNYACGSHYNAWWHCYDCGSDYQMMIYMRTNEVNSGCPFCAGKRTNNTNALAILQPRIATEWHPIKNGLYTPHDFTCGSDHMVWWICSECKYEYQSSIKNRTKGHGCANCNRHKNEKLTGEYLLDLFNRTAIEFQFIVKREPPFTRCIVDFCLSLNGCQYFIEYNGEQHYTPTRFGGMDQEIADINFAKQIARDKWLFDYCMINNIILIVIDGRKYKGIDIQQHLRDIFDIRTEI
jgi:very-short-patch-repair endonuclease